MGPAGELPNIVYDDLRPLMALPVYSLSQLNTTYQPMYDNVTESVGCSKATDTLACLRHVPYKTFYDAVSPFSIYPIVDGDFLTRLPSESFEKGLIADVAILAGTNTDECTAFAPRRMTSMNERVTPAVALALGRILDNDNDTRTLISEINNGALENNPTAVAKIMELYPDNPVLGCPFGTGLERFVDQGGKQYKRGAALITDEIFHAGRRFTVKTYASRLQQQRKPVYSFRFDQTPWNGKEEIMAPVAPCNATHFSEVCLNAFLESLSRVCD
jgi:carboxylesterase type B